MTHFWYHATTSTVKSSNYFYLQMDLAFSSRGLIVLKSSSLDYFYASENEDNKIESNQGARVTTIEGLEFEKYFLTSEMSTFTNSRFDSNLSIFLLSWKVRPERQIQCGLTEVSKTGPSRLYVVDPWSQIGCTSLYYRVKYSRFGTRGLLRKGESSPVFDTSFIPDW